MTPAVPREILRLSRFLARRADGVGGCRHLGHGETNRWGEELETAVQPSNKCEASRSMYFAERATWAPPALQTGGFTEIGSSALAFSQSTGTTTRSRSTTRFSASRTGLGLSAASGLIFCATADDGSASSIVPLAASGAAESATD